MVCFEKLQETNKGCKFYYDILNGKDVKPSCRSKQEDKLQRNVPWQFCFRQLSKIHDVNMKWFQMRMEQIIMILNEVGVTNNSKYSFCRIAKHTILHIFWEHTQPTVLDTALVLLNETCTSCYRLRLSECQISFGIDDDIKTENVFNCVLLPEKQHLYKINAKQKNSFRTVIYSGNINKTKQMNIMLR